MNTSQDILKLETELSKIEIQMKELRIKAYIAGLNSRLDARQEYFQRIKSLKVQSREMRKILEDSQYCHEVSAEIDLQPNPLSEKRVSTVLEQ